MRCACPAAHARCAKTRFARSLRNVPLAGLLRGMEYTRTDIVLLVVTTLAVAAFLTYMGFG